MAGIEGLIKLENDETISFGNYLLDSKEKKDNFEVEGNLYKIKTYRKITKLEKNGRLLYESVPGTTVYNLELNKDELKFVVEGQEDAQITVELEPSQEYKIYIDDVLLGKVKTNLAGKLNFSVDFSNGKREVEIKKA